MLGVGGVVGLSESVFASVFAAALEGARATPEPDDVGRRATHAGHESPPSRVLIQMAWQVSAQVETCHAEYARDATGCIGVMPLKRENGDGMDTRFQQPEGIDFNLRPEYPNTQISEYPNN